MIINQLAGGVNIKDALLTQYPIHPDFEAVSPGQFIKFIDDGGDYYVVRSFGNDTVIGVDAARLEERVISNNNTINYLKCVKLDNNRVLIVYHYSDGTNYNVEARVIKLYQGVYSYGTPFKIVTSSSAITTSLSVAKISENKVMISYANIANSNQISGRILNIDGSTITAPTAVATISTTTNCTLMGSWYQGDNVAWILYGTGTSSLTLRARRITISGTSLTSGTETSTSIGVGLGMSDFQIVSGTKVLLCFYNNTNVNCCVLSVSESLLSSTSPVVIYDGDINNPLHMTKLTDTQYLVSMSAPQGVVIPVTLNTSTNSITFENSYMFNTYSTSLIGISRATDTKAIITYTSSNDSTKFVAKVVTVSGSTLSFGTQKEISVGNTYNFNEAINISRDCSLFFYISNTTSGAALYIATLSPDVSDSTLVREGISFDKYGDGVIDGIARSGGQPGESIYIYTLPGTVESALEAMTANTFVETI